MATYLSIVFGALLKLLAVAAGALYAGMVLTKYRTVGRHYRINLELRDPARSAEHLVVWLGVKVLDACLRCASVVLNMLLEASIEVAEWFIRRSPAVQERVRSRFLV
jgi:predicted Kef-type K+ transport protein